MHNSKVDTINVNSKPKLLWNPNIKKIKKMK